MVMNKNYSGLDVGKLFFSICVVAIHAELFLDISNFLYVNLNRYVFSVAVPFFFMCSGFLCEHKIRKNKSGDRLKKNIAQLLKVYCIWGGIYVFLNIGKLYIQGDTLKNIISETVHNILIGKPGGVCGMYHR